MPINKAGFHDLPAELAERRAGNRSLDKPVDEIRHRYGLLEDPGFVACDLVGSPPVARVTAAGYAAAQAAAGRGANAFDLYVAHLFGRTVDLQRAGGNCFPPPDARQRLGRSAPGFAALRRLGSRLLHTRGGIPKGPGRRASNRRAPAPGSGPILVSARRFGIEHRCRRRTCGPGRVPMGTVAAMLAPAASFAVGDQCGERRPTADEGVELRRAGPWSRSSHPGAVRAGAAVRRRGGPWYGAARRSCTARRGCRRSLRQDPSTDARAAPTSFCATSRQSWSRSSCSPSTSRRSVRPVAPNRRAAEDCSEQPGHGGGEPTQTLNRESRGERTWPR